MHRIFDIKSDKEFNQIAIKIFNFQFKNIKIYKDYVNQKNISADKINHYTQIPFLPIEFFKTHKVAYDLNHIEKIFLSSGTTKINRSKHYVKSLNLYEKSFLQQFLNVYGDPKDWTILALLPSYLEQGDSSLIYMVDYLIKYSDSINSRYVNINTFKSKTFLNKLKNKKVMLFGVSYALLDLAELKIPSLENWTIIETGGMKGRRKEMTREELHSKLKKSFKVKNIHSEYGMSELLSQCYSKKDGIYNSPKWLKIIIRDLEDPFSQVDNGSIGAVNVIDLANIFSCSFIETQDIGIRYKNNTFKILGRTDHSEIRGCNLLNI
mgnify:CR=1 FL=1